MAVPKEVAQWMADQLEKNGALSQEEAVADIERLFGPGFVNETDAGGLSIASSVRQHFQQLTEGHAEWDRDDQTWWKR